MSSTERRWYARGWSLAFLIAIVVGLTGFVTARALGLRTVPVSAEPMPLPNVGFDYAWWDGALRRWVRGDLVDYVSVRSEESDLRRFVATLAEVGPESTPDRFRTEPERLAYYLNAYNALVLFGVVDNWPISSVHDVHGWLDPRAGFGFFYGLRFPLDQRSTSLYDLENGVIRGFLDARIHAAINCASASCPALRGYAFEPEVLDEQLDEVTRAFCSSPTHVRVDEEARALRLSAIFDWYRADFEEHARRLGRSATLVGFITAFADPSVADAVGRAEAEGFAVEIDPYDWSLNAVQGG